MQKAMEWLQDWKNLLLVSAIALLVLALIWGFWELFLGGAAAIPKTIDLVKPLLKNREKIEDVTREEKAELRKEKRRLRRRLKEVDKDTQEKTSKELREKLLEGIDNV